MAGEHYSVQKLAGSGNQTVQLLAGLQTDLAARSRDPANLIAALAAGEPALTKQERVQKDADLKHQAETQTLHQMKGAHYKNITSACNLIITEYGVNSPQGQQATQIRKELTGEHSGGSPTNPPAT